MKTRWSIYVLVSALLIGINGCDDSGTADLPDLCPDDPNKTGPGVCGCGVADALITRAFFLRISVGRM